MTARTTMLHEAIFASAGTGKTEELAFRYISLLDLQRARGRNADAILALTFTRNAAWEMLQRIAEKLADAVIDPAKCAQLAEGLGRALTQADAGILLDTLVDNFHRLRISTIDSFMFGIFGCYTFETGMANPPRMAEFHPVRDWNQRVLARLFEHDARLSATVSTIASLFTDLCGEEKDAYVAESLLNVVTCGRALCRMSNAGAWKAVKPCGTSVSDQEIADALAAATPFLGQCDARLSPILEKWLDAARHGACNPREILGHTLGKNMLQDAPKYYKVLPSDLVSVLKPMFAGIAVRLIKAAVTRTEAFRKFLDRFEPMLHAVQAEANVLGFEDIADMLSRRLHAEGQDAIALTDIYYRLDGAVEHLLVDEFQDTSWDQWRALAPIATEILQDDSATRSYFMVGDRKQAIYSFRGGDARLFTVITKRFGKAIGTRDLNESYRFGTNIAATVNTTFGDPGLELWRNTTGFAPHKGIARERTTGTPINDYAELRLIDPTGHEDDGNDGALVGAAARLIQALQPLDRGLTTAVLCTTNEIAGNMVSALRARGIRAFEQGKSIVAEVPAVAVVLSLLEWCDDPANEVAAYHVRNSYLAARLPKDESAFLRDLHARFVYQSYPDVIRWLVAPVVGSLSAREQGYVRRLENVAALYAPNATSRPSAFVQFVRTVGIALPTPSEGIACMTIHAAKGLTFDVVVFPVPCRSSKGGFGHKLLYRESGEPDMDDGPNISHVLVSPGSNVDLYDEHVAAMTDAADTREQIDRFNGLYVAMTRPRRALYVMTDAKNDGSDSLTMPKLLLRALGRTPPTDPTDLLATGGTILYAKGDAQWYAPHIKDTPPGAGHPAVAQALKLTPVAHRYRPVVAPSRHEAPRSSLFARTGPDAARRGTVLHVLYQQITWLDDVATLDPVRLNATVAAVAPNLTDDERDEIIAQFRAGLASTRIRCLFARPVEPCMVRTEMPFAHIVDDRLVTGVMDRVVFYPDMAKPCRISIVDYKSDDVTDPAKREQRERDYQPQLDLYKKALSKAYNLHADRISAELVFV